MRFLKRLLNLLRVRRPDDELTREIDAHLALLQDTYEARGYSAADARRAARVAFGNVPRVKEEHRDARSFRWIEDACQDAAHGLRLLRRSPVFTATAVVSLAVGIGANTAIFTVANALLFRPPTGVVDPSALVVIGTSRGDGGLNPLNGQAWREISRRTTLLTGVFAQDLFPHVMGLVPAGSAQAEAVRGWGVSANFFDVLGAVPARGRLFAESDQASAVLDHGYWTRRFNADAAVIGQIVRVNGRPVTIVGVAAADFQGIGFQTCDMWLAVGTADPLPGSVMAGGRLRPGATVDMAAAELAAIGLAVERDLGATGNRQPPLNARPFSRAGANGNLVAGFSGVLMALVSLVLAAACANVAGIMLTRATAREREIALRSALGAGRGRLLRQLLTETMVLFLFGGLLGMGLARILPSLAMLMLPPLPAPLAVPFALDWRVWLFATTLSIAAAVIFGVLPASRGSRVDAGASLKEGARSSSGRSRLRSAFVVGQIACSVLLVVIGASFVRALRHAGADNPGFDPRGVDVAAIEASVSGGTSSPAFWETVIDRVRRAPAVERASLARVPPGGVEGIGLGGVTRGDKPDTGGGFIPGWNIVDTGYFATLRIPHVAGRDFAATDTGGAPHVVIVSETVARRLWPGEEAVGQLLRLPPTNPRDHSAAAPVAMVVGVVGDIKSSSLVDGLAEPYVYVPLAQSDVLEKGMTGQMSIVARRRAGGSLTGTLAALVQTIDSRLVLARTESLTDAIAFGLTPQRVFAAISSVMGLVAVLLASMGIYGVTAYTVALRRRELAIRLALGATRARVIRMVFEQGAWLVAAGLAIGLVLAIGAGQVLSVFLYGLPAAHLPTLAGTVALFLVIGVAASTVPAARAVGDGSRRALQEE